MGRPNVILIVSDGHRWDCAGFAGDRDVSTPNLDAIASYGVVFTQAVTPSLLDMPSRASLLSGTYPKAHGVTAEPASVASFKPTLLLGLRKAGYQTCCVGHAAFPEERVHEWFDTARLVEHESGTNAACPVAATGDQAVRALQRAEEPFFLWLGFREPAAGSFRTAPKIPKIDRVPDGWGVGEARGRSTLARYRAAIAAFDHEIGRVLATLTARGFTNNILVYCSDHGVRVAKDGHRVVYDHAKPVEAVVRVPLVIAGLAAQRRKAASPVLASLVDVAPTVFDAADLDLPAGLDGSSLAPTLRGGHPLQRRAAFIEGAPGVKAVRTRRCKLVETPEQSGRGLYDIERDPLEIDNLYNRRETSPIQAELTLALDSFTIRSSRHS